MNTQSINNTATFKALYVQKGALNYIKTSPYIPTNLQVTKQDSLLNFYRKIKDLKKACEQNNTYNIIFKNDHVAIENSEKIEQAGFIVNYQSLLGYSSKEEKEKRPDFINIIYKVFNKLYGKKTKENKIQYIEMDEYLKVVYGRIKDIYENAEYLTYLNSKHL